MLQIGQKVRTQIVGESLTVLKKLGEGGQGAVYLVKGDTYGQKVVKWYNAEQSTDEQRKSILELIHHGSPKGEAGKRFVWPLDLVVADGTVQFGYLMDLIDTARFAELGEVWSGKRRAPSMSAMCRITHRIADSYRKLHLDGLCYRDISKGNIMFDPQTGEVLICDNDNIGVNLSSETQIWGTMEYMAPELVRGEALPSTSTDQHSLAVLLFQLWVWHHPMHGQMEYNIRSWDLPAKKKIYGQQPVFIFDPSDPSNSLPNDPEYATARRRWDLVPELLKRKFMQAFTIGLHQPSNRVTEGEWRSVAQELEDCIVACPHDQAENFWQESGQASSACWYCSKPLNLPPRLKIHGISSKRHFVLNPNSVIKKSHVDFGGNEALADESVAQLVQNPNNPSVWGIRNLSSSPWDAVVSGETKVIDPGRAISLSAGLRIRFSNGVEAELLS